MSTIVQRLDERAPAVLLTHFVALSPEDRRLRFGSPLSAELIARYVERIDFDRDAVFGVHDLSLTLVGAAHVAFLDDHAELGLSVLPGHRGRGVGSALFERAAAHARNRSVPRLYMHCLNENAAVVHIARKFGMHIVAEAGEADAHLELAPASPGSIAGEFVTDRLALYDYALKSHVATWKGVKMALTG
jgi:GNAT superfamily N-acetyltransferase